jgi:putative flippase GtrA
LPGYIALLSKLFNQHYQLLRFGVVGVVGFIVDAGVLVALVQLLGIAPLPARIASFLIAASVTFVLNQRFTFRLNDGFSMKRWLSYLLTTAVGACVNVGIYHLWIAHAGITTADLTLGTALGSLTAMFVNYFASSLLVFRAAKQRSIS